MQILELRQARELVQKWKGERDYLVVATNGCFDILHAGHVRMLEDARKHGDKLVVGVNSDESVRQLKGPSRPVNTLEDRMAVLRALACVDLVVPFHDMRATKFLAGIQPHVYVKAGDYTLETLDPGERDVLLKNGTEIVFVPLLDGRSTTSLVKRIEAQANPAGYTVLPTESTTTQ